MSEYKENKINNFILWLIIFILIIVGYAFRFELDYVYQRVLAVLVPSYVSEQDGQIVIARNPDGHFYVDAVINGTKIHFMIDTGATGVALSSKDAMKLKFDLSKLSYTKSYSTANGIAKSAPVNLKNFKIGNKNLSNVNASISQNGNLDTSLLGMSVISKFSSFKIDKDILILSY
jgi:aspartyl protease family protein